MTFEYIVLHRRQAVILAGADHVPVRVEGTPLDIPGWPGCERWRFVPAGPTPPPSPGSGLAVPQ